MIIPKILTLVIFRQLQIGAAAAPVAPSFRHKSSGRSASLQVSPIMKAAKGWPPISSKCGLHDYYSSVSIAPLDSFADCSVQGDLRADTAKLKQCLAECCAAKNCVGISAKSTGTMLVQTFEYAQQDNTADSYMVQVPNFALGSKIVESTAESKTTSIGGHRVATAMINKRGFPPMSSQCGRHDFYGEIGSSPVAEIGDCSKSGDIRKDFHSLQGCLDECCQLDSCIGISATIDGTKFVHSFEFIKVDANSNSYMLNKLDAKHSASGHAASKSVGGRENYAASSGTTLESKKGTENATGSISGKAKTQAVAEDLTVSRGTNSSNEKGKAVSTNGASKHGVSATDSPTATAVLKNRQNLKAVSTNGASKHAVSATDSPNATVVLKNKQHVETWPSVAETCGKRYDFHGGMAARSSSVLGACSEKGDIRENYSKIRRCFAECCATQNCLGISVSPTGAELVQSFTGAILDDDTDSFALERIPAAALKSQKSEATITSEGNARVSKVSITMMDRRGFPSMGATCGRHDFFGKIAASPSAVIGHCSSKGDIREDFPKLQMCLNQCCASDACIGISATVNGTKFVQSFELANVDNNSNSYMPHVYWLANLAETATPAKGASNSSSKAAIPVNSESRLSVKTTLPTHKGSKFSAKAAKSSAKTASTGEAESDNQKGTEAATESQQGTGVAKKSISDGFADALSGEIAAAMTKAKSWPSVDANCGKRYDFYGGIAGRASSALGNCHVKGDIRDNYSKLKICLQMCCRNAKCVGITASPRGTKLIKSFSTVSMDDDQNSYLRH